MKVVKAMNIVGPISGVVIMIIAVALAVSAAADSSKYNGNY